MKAPLNSTQTFVLFPYPYVKTCFYFSFCKKCSTRSISRCITRDVLIFFSNVSEGIRKDVLWYLTKGNSKMVLMDELLFVDCDTSSYIILEFPWEARSILESRDSEETCERKKEREKRKPSANSQHFTVLRDF